VADLERHIPMAERLDNDPGDAGRMARSFLAAMQENADLRARLAENEVAFRKMAETAEAYSRELHKAKAALARVEALCNLVETYDHPVAWHTEIRAALAGDRGPQDPKNFLADLEPPKYDVIERSHARPWVRWGVFIIARLYRENDDLRVRAEAAEAEIAFMRAWCADHFGGLMPPTREQNAALMRALDEMEDDRGE
jgi:hypothetical protein